MGKLYRAVQYLLLVLGVAIVVQSIMMAEQANFIISFDPLPNAVLENGSLFTVPWTYYAQAGILTGLIAMGLSGILFYMHRAQNMNTTMRLDG